MEITIDESKINIGINCWNKFRLSKKQYTKLFVVIDERVYSLYTKEIKKLLYGFNYHKIILKDPENEKNLNVINKLTKEAVEFNLSRYDALLAIGGGAIGDIAGFFASIYKRGIDFYSFPTTLIAQVDSSIGGKTALNFGGDKNVLGSFYPAKEVYIDPYFLKSLEDYDFLGGLGEVVKYGLLNSDFLLTIKRHLPSILEGRLALMEEIVKESVLIKANVVTKDYFETKGLRISLNLGHTLGHLIENKDPDRLNHGLSVLVGLDFAIFVSLKLGYLSKKEYSERKFILDLLLKYIPQFKVSNYIHYFDRLQTDKKYKDSGIQFVLPTPGKFETKVLTYNQFKNYIMEFGEKND